MERFIVVLTENRHLGLLLTPYLVEDNEDTPSISLTEQVDTEKTDRYEYSFSEEEQSLLSM